MENNKNDVIKIKVLNNFNVYLLKSLLILNTTHVEDFYIGTINLR